MSHFNVLWDGAEVPPSGSPAPAPNTYEISAIPAPAPDSDFPLSMQWQSDGVDLGEPNVRVINFITALDEFLVTRGTGEQSNVITVRKLAAPPPPPVTDPCYEETVLLIQRGVMVDTSPYARSLADPSIYEVTQEVALPGSPSGRGISVVGDLSTTGIVMGYGPEMELYGTTKARYFRIFIKIAEGALATQSQIIYNDGFGFRGVVWQIEQSTGRITIQSDGSGTLVASDPALTPVITDGELWYVCTQIHAGGAVEMWAGRPGVDAVALGGPALASFTYPPNPIEAGPYVAYVAGVSAGVNNNYIFDGLDIVDCDRFTGASVEIPTTLYADPIVTPAPPPLPTPAGPTVISSTSNGIGTVVAGDLVVLYLLVAGGAAPAAPSGWTRIVNTTEANGYALAVYKSIYSVSNAVANTTNFPIGLGYFICEVYRSTGTCDVLQVGSKTEVGAPTSTLPVTALASATALTSILKGWTSSRDPAAYQASVEGMTKRFSDTYAFFTAALWDQDGVQSGSRSFTRSSSAFNFLGFLFEIGLA